MSTTLWASSQILVRTWMTNHLCWKLELGVSRIIRNIYLKNISTWYFRWALNFVKNDRNIASKSSNTSQILETPFLDSDTHKYCFTAEMNISLDLKTGPAFWTTDNGGPTGNVEIIRLGMHLFGKYLQTGIAASPFSLFEYIKYHYYHHSWCQLQQNWLFPDCCALLHFSESGLSSSSYSCPTSTTSRLVASSTTFLSLSWCWLEYYSEPE